MSKENLYLAERLTSQQLIEMWIGEFGPHMPLQEILCLFLIADGERLNRPLDLKTLAKRVGCARSTASRYVADLSDLPGGLGLIRMETDLRDRRVKRLYPIAKLRRIQTRMLKKLHAINAEHFGRAA
ncbi:MAG: MarR family winged helix-turn-helix transcriptional regulator [Gammaproteobacteria bacterium]